MSEHVTDIDLDLAGLNPTQRVAVLDMAPGLLRLSGGLGSGKTSIGAVKAMILSAVNPGVPGALWAKSYAQLKANCLRTLSRHLPPEAMRIHDPSGERHLLWNGAPVFLCTAEGAENRDGINVGWYWADEVRHYKREPIQIMVSRHRVPCPVHQAVWTTTPGGVLTEFAGAENVDARTLRLKTSENAHNLEPSYIRRLMQSYSPRMLKAFLDGEDVALEGAVYEQLPADIWSSPWVVDYAPVPQRRTFLAIDPGFRRSAWFLAQEVGPMEWVAFHEWLGERQTDDAMVQRVLDTCAANKWQIDEIWIDPAADATQSAFGLDTLAMLRKIPTRRRRAEERTTFMVTAPYNAIEWGVDKLRTLLGDPANHLPIRLKFARALREIEAGRDFGLVRSLCALRYPDEKARHSLSIVPEEDPLHEHFGDAARYFAVGRWLRSDLRSIDPRIGAKQGYRVA